MKSRDDEILEAAEEFCKRNDIVEAVQDYYGDCATALANLRLVKRRIAFQID